MAHMSMNLVIHAAVRRDLARFASALRDFPAGDGDRARQLGVAWANLDLQLTHHHEGEHAIAWPALRSVGVPQETLDEMDAEHDTMAGALERAREQMTALGRDQGPEQVASTLAAIEELESVTAAHLEHEEREIEPVVQAKADTPEIKAMGRAFGKVSPAQGGQFFAWVTDGASPDELAAFRASVPAPVAAIMGGLFGRRYRREVAPVWR